MGLVCGMCTRKIYMGFVNSPPYIYLLDTHQYPAKDYLTKEERKKKMHVHAESR